jgi:hypothetical protein
MRAWRSWLAVAVAGAVALIASLACYRATVRGPTQAVLIDASGAERPIAFPYRQEDASTTRPMEFHFHLRGGVLAPTSLVFVPDDHFVSLAIDGREVPLTGIDPKKLDDYGSGFSLPLGKELPGGDHQVVAKVLNRGGGPGGLDVRPDPAERRHKWELLTATVGGLVLVGASMFAAGCRWVGVLLALAAIGIRLAYLWVTSFTVRAHDAQEHLDYVQYLLDHHKLPKASDGYAFYHPPLYYLASALVQAVFNAMGFSRGDVRVVLQLQSVVFALVFTALSIATVRLWLDRLPESDAGRGPWSRGGLLLLGAALLVFWPSGVMHSARIGNDDLTYLFFGAAMYFASRWWVRRPSKAMDLHAAAIFGALGIVTKTNSLLLFAVFGAMIVVRLLRERERRLLAILRNAGPVVLLFAVSTGIALHESFARVLAGDKNNLLVANAHMNSTALAVGNRADNYIWFDLRTFVTSPFTSAWDDARGRQYFWNYLLKTSLFGEWEFSDAWVTNLAVLLSVLLLGILAAAAVGVLLRERPEWLDELPLHALAILLVASLALLRMKIPNSCTGDFRYILPVLMPLSYAFLRGLMVLRKRGRMRFAGAGLVAGWAFVALSVAFVGLCVWTEP